MIKKNKWKLLVSSIIILLPAIAGLLMWNILPERIATHWGADGEANGWSTRAFTIFGLPLIMLVFHWICILVTALDPKNKNQSNKVFSLIFWIMPIISLTMCGTVYAVALGNADMMDLAVRVLLGLMFVIIGNYMPKCRQNYTIGIKITWTLRNEENWNKTHRFAGRVWVIGGVILLSTIFVPMEKIMWVLLACILILAFLPMIYSYAYYKKQLRAGNVTEEEGKATPLEKKSTAIALSVGIVILVLVGILLLTGDFEVQFGESAFTINTQYWEDATVRYAEIEKIEYRDQDDPGSRTFGYGSLALLMGEFENHEFGSYTRYSYTKCDSCIVLTVDGKILVINGESEESTQDIYDELMKRLSK